MRNAIWTPQPGPQVKAAVCPADEVFFGGSRGGGKSDCAIGRHIRGVEKYGNKWNGLIARRKYKDFGEIRRRIDELIASGLPSERVGGENQANYWRFKCGAQIQLLAFQQIQQANDIQGQQFTEISLDECTNFPFFTQIVDKFKGSLRSPHGVPCRMFFTGNPGGPGHSAVKDRFRLGVEYGQPPETVFYDEAGESRVFIPSFLDDNRILCENDPKYVQRLKSIQDPALRKAWLLGDWDTFIGQAFLFSRDHHVIEPLKIPLNAQVYMTFDWGFGKPFSVGWWWSDNDGRLYRCGEWYGWDGTPDNGLRLTDTQIAEGIIEREQGELNLSTRKILRMAGHDCFNKKPDYKGGGQGKSTAEVFAEHGLYITPADSSRELKIRQFRERLALRGDEMPMLVVYENCKHFIRTIPALCMDELKPEDIDTDQEDHVYDEAAQICMAQTIIPNYRLVSNSPAERIDRYIRGKTANKPWEPPKSRKGGRYVEVEV